MHFKYFSGLWGLVACLCTQADVHHVSLTGSHETPFSSPTTAATNIQDAVDVAGPGDTVLIQAGSYLLNAEIYVAKAITVKGMSGEPPVVIDGGGSHRAFYLEDVSCLVENITITNGYSSEDGGGIYCDGGTPLIQSCRIVDCVALGYGGGVEGGTLANTVLMDNSGSDGGGVDSAVATNCLFIGNSCTAYGGGASFSELYNCTIVSNSAADGGGCDDGCDVYNSVVVGNSASGSGADILAGGIVRYTCSPDVIHATVGNITNHPVFMNASAIDFRLTEDSPGVDAGQNSYVTAEVDLLGKKRIVDGVVDMGAYENQVTLTDTDGDGLLDTWEVYYFGHISNGIPTEHSDADLFNNMDEYIAGTDPLNSQSYFIVSNSLGSDLVVQWESLTNREYAVLWAPSITNNFQIVESGIEHPRDTYTNTAPNPEGFYKVDVKLK